MKTTITLSNPTGSSFGDSKVYRDERVINAYCKSDPSHRMDTERTVYVSGWETKKTLDEALQIFKKDLIERIYENTNIEFEVIDNRRTDLPHKNLY